MFKLVLMGPENFADFIYKVSGVKLSGFQEQTTYLKATSLKLDIATADLFTAGTDDNVFAEVYRVTGGKKTRIMRKLLDKSGYNDFEAGDNDTYYVELPYPVRIDEIEVVIRQEDTNTAGEGWMCENINITPMHAGVELTDAIGVGGNLYMSSGKNWQHSFQAALNERGIADKRKQTVTNVKLAIKTSTKGSTPGTDSDIYLVAYNGSKQVSKVLLDKPRNREEFIINPSLIKAIFGFGGFVFLLCTFVLWGMNNPATINSWGVPWISNFFSSMNLTIFFAAYMILNWWNMFNARVIGKNKSLFDGLGKNGKFTGIMALILIVTIVMVQVGGEVFRTEPLSWQTWGWILLITSPVVVVRELYYQLIGKRN